MPTQRRLVRAHAGAGAGSRCNVAAAWWHRSRDRPAPGRAPATAATSFKAASIRSREKSRLRGSIPIATGRVQRPAGEQPRQQADRHVVDRLEAEILERTDRRRPAGARRPGDDGDFLCLLRASCLSHRVPRAQQTVRACLSRVRRGRSARQSSIPGQDLGGRGRKSIRYRPRGTELSHPVAFVPRVAGRGPPPASAPPPDCAGSPSSPRPRASISPAIGRRRPRHQRRPAPLDAHPVVGDQRRAAADQLQRQRRLAGAGGAENQHAAAAEGHHRAVQDRRASPPPPSPPFPFGPMRKQPNTDLNRI